MRSIILTLALLAAALPTVASATAWGTLTVMAEREWTTEKEPRPRVTKFRWVEPGKVLEARHGFVSRLQFGEAKFADTVQRFVLDGKSDTINVTYTYEDGRPPLKAVIKVQPDGSLIETFTDAKGVKKRNLYKSPAPNVNLIERQEMKGSSWASLGTTRKGGLTQMEIAEIARRKEQERLAAVARENARIAAAAQARRAAEERAYAEQQSYQQEEQSMMGGMNMLDVLNGLGNSIAQENQRQQQAFDQQMRANQAEQARQRAADAQAAADAAAARANSQSYASGSSSGGGGSYGGGGSQVIAPNYAGSGFDLVASGGGGGGSAPTYQSPTSGGGETYQETGGFTGVSTTSEADAWADAFAQCSKAGVSCWKGKVSETSGGNYFYVTAMYYTGRTLTRGSASTVSEQ